MVPSQKKSVPLDIVHHDGRIFKICHGGPPQKQKCQRSEFRSAQHLGKRGRGIPKTFYVDNGKEFMAHMAHQLYNKLGIHFSFGWAENHQSNPVERFHRTLYNLLISLRAEGESNFVEGVKTAVIFYNEAKHSSTGVTPNMLF